ASTKLTLRSWASATRDLAFVNVLASHSTPTTSPVGPTSSATSMATSPTPEPISRTRCPRDMPAFLNKRSVNGLKILACRLSRSCSRPVPPSTYDATGEEIAILTTLQSYVFRTFVWAATRPRPGPCRVSESVSQLRSRVVPHIALNRAAAQCPLWVKSRHWHVSRLCPLCPQ